MEREFKCPRCKERAPMGTPYFPFCCDKCKLIDLGKWANEEYAVPVVASPEGIMESQEEGE